MSRYTAHAKRWAHGWELHIDGVGVTQSRTLAAAPDMVRDYIATLYDVDAADAEIAVVPELGGLEERVAVTRERTKNAEIQQRAAAQAARELARELRSSGMSVSDTAVILGVSRGRVSQLVR